MPSELRLPDGSYTRDASRFSEEWDLFRKPFEAMGFCVVGFDPHIALCDAETGRGHFQLPLYAAKKFIALNQGATSTISLSLLDKDELTDERVAYAWEVTQDGKTVLVTAQEFTRSTYERGTFKPLFDK